MMYLTLVFIICFFFLLLHFRSMENPKENFTNIETFDDSIPSIQDMKDYIDEKVETASEESYEQPLDSTKLPENTKNTETEINNKLEAESSQGNVCRSDTGNSDKGDCLFGCPKEDSKETNLAEMMSTIEETEKICDMIEEKDRLRKAKEEEEALKTQLELNRKFLIQQKAQNKQIQDLEKIVKSMAFTEEINKAAIEKCGDNTEQCLRQKEQDLKKLLLDKQKQQKSVQININMKDFGSLFTNHMLNKIGLSPDEINNLLGGVNKGALNLKDLQSQLGYNANGNGNGNGNGNMMDDGDCPSCEVDLSEYIDRCKIPCHKCRDPKWKCPQDIKK